MTLGRFNSKKCHISGDGKLVNRELRQHHSGGLEKYYGACGRETMPLTTSLSCTVRYYETHTQVRVEGGRWWYILEMGVCQEGEVDTECWVSYQTRSSWAVFVVRCGKHGDRVCTQVWGKEGQVGKCWTNTMSRKPGTTAVLKYGVVLDVGKGRLAFIDLNRKTVLHKFDVQFTESLRPMFGVCPDTANCTVKMKLISGEEITMTDTKKDLISQALTST